MFKTIFATNLEEIRLEAEISDAKENLVALIYEEVDGWHVNSVDSSVGTLLDLSQEFIDNVKTKMKQYVNRTGEG